MKSRRDFFKTVAAAGVLTAGSARAADALAQALVPAAVGRDARRSWVAVLERLADPVLGCLSKRELKKAMPVETTGAAADRRKFTHLEAFGRLLAGMAPWLEARGLDEAEEKLQNKFSGQARAALDAATDPQSQDFMNFREGGQPMVDAAFLAEGILRAPHALWEPLESRVRRQVADALKATRAHRLPASNWVMFAATAVQIRI